MKSKAITFLSSIFIYLSIVAFTPLTFNSSVLIDEGPTCKARLGGSCECESGQTCEAGVFKCKCTAPEIEKAL
ncbi:MAG TPA: hypothetical protein VJ951_02200 [Bacteroidales bacterium]|nr:hypothetical protein [Bacteroidales bacterium]